MAMGVLCACGAPVSRPMPLAESGPSMVMMGSTSYMADLQPGETGITLAVTRDGVPLGYADGLEAKRAAEIFCKRRNGRLMSTALGHFVDGAWQFEGGCI